MKHTIIMPDSDPTLFISAEESDRWHADPDLQREVLEECRQAAARRGGGHVTVCTTGGFMSAVFDGNKGEWLWGGGE